MFYFSTFEIKNTTFAFDLKAIFVGFREKSIIHLLQKFYKKDAFFVYKIDHLKLLYYKNPTIKIFHNLFYAY